MLNWTDANFFIAQCPAFLPTRAILRPAGSRELGACTGPGTRDSRLPLCLVVGLDLADNEPDES